MTIVQELLAKVKKGATDNTNSNPNVDNSSFDEEQAEAAIEACKIILKEDYLGMCGWPEKPMRLPTNAPEGMEENLRHAQKKVYAPRPNDKGYKMKAKLTGTCKICNSGIMIGEDIYYKKGDGANHVTCRDEVTEATEV